ncbi:HIT family protein [Dechloromonas sp. ZY10]|uniref:HIT family protein n=1 Tax=Dechloromonas aquae TaxID=2664436 RepID=UPI0035298B9E
MSPSTPNHPENCPLCREDGGTLLWRNSQLRVIRVNDPDYPGFCRVVWQAHVREMSDLDPTQQQQLMQTVFAVERVVRELFTPDKINLASFGNMVPHVHWHVIPRWQDDRHFPEPVWGQPQRTPNAVRPQVSDDALAAALTTALAAANGPN